MRRNQDLHLIPALKLVWQSGPPVMIVAIVVMLLQGILPIVPIYVVKLIVEAVEAARPFSSVLTLLVVAGAATLLNAGMQSIGGYVREAQSQALTDHVQSLIHEKSLELGLSYYEGPEFFDKLHRAQEEAPSRPAQVVNDLLTILRSGTSIVGIAGVLLYSLPWYIVAVLAVSAIPMGVVRLITSGRLFSWRMTRTSAERRVYYLNWLITGRPHAKEIRLFGLGKLLKERSEEWRRRLRRERLALAAKRSGWEFLAAALQAITIIGLLAYLTYQGIQSNTTIGSLVLFFQAVQKGQQVMAEMLHGVAGLYESNLFLANVFEFFGLSPAITYPKGSSVTTEGFPRGIEIDHVRFAYPNSENPVLHDISMSIGQGEIVALVGDNGAGKTTLIKLLCRFYDPVAGTIRMDGRDIKTVEEKELRQRMAVLFQEPAQYFFPAWENIWFGDVNSDRDDQRIQAAARQARADRFLSDLPHGYETHLGRWLEEGAELSGGQWKKVALARTLYRDAPILIFDEPTAGIDPESEAQFIDALPSLAEGKSILLVSHKVAPVRQADRVYVMREGRIIEHGSHEELVALGGYYAGMYKTQLRQMQRGRNG